MGQYVRWQAIIAAAGSILLLIFLSSIVVTKTTIIVPADGGTYREGAVGTAQYLNPLLAPYNPIDLDITSLIFEGLTHDDGLGNLQPALAESWSVSEDGRVYDFVLRQDVRWADGTPFTIDDVLFTIGLIQSPDFPGDSGWRDLWQSVSVEQIDDLTIRFVLEEPLSAFLHHTATGILPSHILGDVTPPELLTHPFNLSPVGTGPFKVKEATQQHVLLERNPRYHQSVGKIEQIDFKFYPTAAAREQAFDAGAIDGLGGVQPETLQRLQQQSDVQLFSATLPRYDVIYLNLQQPEKLPFFQDNTVRQALLMSLDRQTMIDDVLAGQAVPASGPILPWSWAHNPHQAYPDYNLAKAAELLDIAGWLDSDDDGIRDKDGVPFQFTVLVSQNPLHIQAAENLAAQWQEIGIDARVEVIADALSQQLNARDFEAALIEVELLGDPDPYRFWHQTQIEQGQNFAGWDSVEASLALEKIRIAVDQTDKIEPFYDFQRIFADETPALILYYPVYSYAVRDTVKNVQVPPMVEPADRFRNFDDWYLLTKRVIEKVANENFSP